MAASRRAWLSRWSGRCGRASAILSASTCTSARPARTSSTRAAMLVARRALEPLLSDVSATAAIAATLADRHRSTAIAGRTLLQQALPTSFGLRAAGWMVGLDFARTRLRDIRARVLAVQMGGPVGSQVARGRAAGVGRAWARRTAVGMAHRPHPGGRAGGRPRNARGRARKGRPRRDVAGAGRGGRAARVGRCRTGTFLRR